MQTNSFIPKNSKQIFIDGPVGKLDCLELALIDTDITGIAIVFHPDPLAGGTYTNKIVQTLARTLSNKGYLCYCPNLRGVGMSDGVHDYGIGEIDDAISIYNYSRTKYPNLPLIIGGFSFGSAIASGLGSRVEHKKLILIGPAVSRFKVIVPDTSKTIVIHGKNDEVISLEDVLKWGEENNQPIICYPNTGHFFHGELLGLQSLLNSFDL